VIVEVGCFAHAINGGLVINPKAESTVKNHYAVGEASTGAHGADRLGGNMLITCVVFGNNAAEKAKVQETPKLDESHWIAYIKGLSPISFLPKTIDATKLLKPLQDLNYNNLLINRSEEKCILVEEGLKILESDLPTVSYKRCSAWMKFNLNNLLLVSHPMVEAVRFRKESRGSHFRQDYKEEDKSFDKPYFFNE
jgi:aspartate oxidase